MANTVYSASLKMTADVSQAKSQLQDLQNTLSNLITSTAKNTSLGDTLTKDLAKAQSAAVQLQASLSNATNVNTGKLDLTKFSDSLKRSNTDLNQLYNNLSAFGAEGNKAFYQLTNSIMSAEVPLKRTSKLFDDLWITMKNTMKWQLTSSAMHGFMSTLSGAYGYAKDLNKSLNDIRIVTQYSTDQMSQFAKQANEAAKALKTTTTSYTDAALIYYQQGLAEKDIKARTDATIKMANVTGESAKEVSDYMTAIWNNFDNGSKSLEYYADVMTALGAATASSTDEIAAGLEKFAAVSETVGLSYEYATAALATVTAETRQNADVVGNAFKTLFSRIQGLNLGETMEDGTTLNKYSAALDKVGISIKDTSGEIKDMDVILDELGNKWDTLSKDTQLGLAQTVAGVRQYTQLIALMDNWGEFKINLKVAEDASGTLQEQQDIYAESWEAASKKVKASLEGVYDSLLNDKFFINLTNGFALVLNSIENVIDGLGGMKGAFFALSAITTKIFNKQLTESVSNLAFGIKGKLGITQLQSENLRNTAIELSRKGISKADTPVEYANQLVQEDNLQLNKQLAEVAQQITQEDYNQYQKLIQLNDLYGQIYIKAKETEQLKKTSMEDKAADFYGTYRNFGKDSGFSVGKYINTMSSARNKADEAYNKYNTGLGLIAEIEELSKKKGDYKNQVESLSKEIFGGADISHFISEKNFSGLEKILKKELDGAISSISDDLIKSTDFDLGFTPEEITTLTTKLKEYIQTYVSYKKAVNDGNNAEQAYINAKQEVSKATEQLNKNMNSLSKSFVNAFSGLSNLGMGISALSSLKDVFTNEDLTNWERFSQTLTSIGIGLPALISGISSTAKSFKEIKNGITNAYDSAIELYLNKLKADQILLRNENASAAEREAAKKRLSAVASGQETAAELTANHAKKALLKNIGSLIGKFGLYAAAIGAVVAIVYSLVKAYNADADVAKKARENLEEATKVAESAKQAYSDLLTSIENHNNAKTAIEDLTYGTQEWKDAIYEANQEVLTLLKNYPILASYLNRDEDSGLLTITQEGQNIVQQQANLQKINAQNAMLAAQMISNTATNRSNITNAYRNDPGQRQFSFIETEYNSAAQVNNQTGTSKETTKSLWEQDYRNLIDKITYDQNYLQNHTAKEIIEDLGLTVERYFGDYDSNSIGGMSNAAFGEDNLIAFVESIRSTPELFNELAVSVRANIEANKAYAEQIIQNNYAENATYKNSKNKDALDTILSGNISSKAIKDRAYKYMHDGSDGENDAFYQEEYAKAMGYQHIKDKNNGKGVYLVNGKEETISDDVIYQWYALNKIIEETTASLPNLESTLEQLRQDALGGDVNSQAAYSMIKTGSATAGASIGQLQDLKDAGDKEIADFETIYGAENFEAIWTSMGFESAQAYVDAFNDEVKNVEIPVFDVDEKSKENFDKLSLDTAKKIQETMEQLELGPAGAQAGADFLDAFNKLLESGLSQEAIEALAQIDWSKKGSLEEGKQILEDLGYNAENFSGVLEGLAAQAYQLDFSVFEDLKEDLESIAGIVSGLELGSILSEEDYQLLSKYVDELENYFMLTSQGRKFIGTDEDANMIGKEAYNASIEELKKQQAGQQEFETYGYDDDNGNRIKSNWNSWALNADTQTTYEKESYKTNQRKTLDNILANESAEVLGLIGEGYENWKDIDTSTLTSEQIAQFFGQLAEFTSDKIDEQDFQENDQKFIGDSQNINEFDQNVEMVGGYEKAGLTEEQYQSQKQHFQDLANEQAKAAQSYQELNQLMADGEINQEAYQKGLVEQAKQYPALTDEIDAYNEAVTEGNPEKIVEKWNELNKAFKSNQIGKVAKDLQESKKEMETLSNEIEKGAEVNDQYIAASQKMADSLSEIFGVKVDPSFVQENIDDIFTYIETGSGEVLNKLSNKAYISAVPGLSEALLAAGSSIDDFASKITTIDGQSFTIKAGADFSMLNEGLQSAGIKCEELGNYINSISNSGATFSIEGMEAFKNLLDAIQKEDIDAIKAALEDLSGQEMELKSDENAYPTNSKTELTSGGYSGGGGGGSKSSSKSDLTKKLQDAELDTYDKKIERSEKMREGMSPDKASKYIKEEIELLEEEQKILEKQIKSWKKLLKEKVQEFNAEHPEFEIELTDDGMIANLSELYARLQVELENADTEEEVRMIEDIVNDLDDASDYQQRIDDNVAAIADKERQQAEKALEEITERIDQRIKQIDYQIERLNYYQEKLLIQAHGNKQTIEAMLEGFQYQEQEMLQLFEKGAALRQGIDELNAAKAQYPGYSQMFDEQILEYQSDLIDVNMDILNLRKEMEELVQNVLELALEEIDTQTGRIDKYVSMLDHFNNIIDLSGRTMLDQSLKVKIGTMKVETMVNKMQILKQQMEGLATATKEAQDALVRRAADGDETSVKFWENQVEELKHELETATDEFLGSWEETLNTAVELFEMRVELAVNTLSDALSPFSTLELFQQNYEQEKHIQDQYLDDAKKLYELNKLNRELNKAITDENDLLAKSKLREIQQQIYDLQKAGVEMSQFDLDILQKKYDLRLAEIALLESQNSKTSMRLVRDAAGNWTYVYDADEEKIEDATQKYEDALYELDQLAKEYINDVSEQLIENQIEYKDALMDLDKNAADYQEQLIGLQEYYTERQRYLLSELNKSVEESGILFHETLYGQMTDIYNYEDAYNQFIKNSNLTITELMTNYKDWQGIVEQAMNVAGTSWENFGVDTEGTLGSLESYIQQLCDEISKLVDVLMSYVSEAIGMVEEWQSKYSKQTDSELAKNEQYINGSFSGGNGKKQEVDMRTDWERVIRELAAGKTGVTDAYGNEVTDIKYAAEMRELKRHAAIGGTRIQYERSGEDFTDEHQKAAVDKLTAEMLRDIANEMVSGDTGLYTGSWPTSEGMDGKGGKLAILHSKELLLNQKDTENILKAVEYTRSKEIGSSIDNKIQNMLLSAGEQFKSLVEQVQLSSYSSLQLPIEQIVHINADFPSVTNSNEIEEAFANLTNDASQYLNIKKF